MAAFALVAAAGGLIYLLVLMKPDPPEPAVTLADDDDFAITYYDRQPPNPGGKNDLAALKQLFSGRPQDKGRSTQLVFISRHSEVDPDPDRLTWINVRAEEDSRAPMRFRDLDQKLKLKQGDNVVLFIDIGRLEPDWDLGRYLHATPSLSLNASFPPSRKALRARGVENVILVCGSGPGETSWQTVFPQDPRPRSVFGYFLEKGLRGDSVPDRTQRISTEGLIEYLQHKVGGAAEKRGESQTVTVFPKKNRTTIELFRPPLGTKQTLAQKDAAAAEAPGEPAGASAKPNGQTKRTEAIDHPSDQSESAVKGAGPSSVKDESVAKSPSAGEPPAQNVKQDKPATTKKDATIQELWGRLDKKIQTRQQLQQSLWAAPYSLRWVQARLIRAEQILQADPTADKETPPDDVLGHDRYEDILKSAKKGLDEIDLTVDRAVRPEEETKSEVSRFEKAVGKLKTTAKQPPGNLPELHGLERDRFAKWFKAKYLDVPEIRLTSAQVRACIEYAFGTEQSGQPVEWQFVSRLCEVDLLKDEPELFRSAMTIAFQAERLGELLDPDTPVPELWQNVRTQLEEGFDCAGGCAVVALGKAKLENRRPQRGQDNAESCEKSV